MRALLLDDLAVVLPTLLDEKAGVLEGTVCGRLYRPYLVALLASIEGLPPAGAGERPLAEVLEEAELVTETIALLGELRDAIATELSTDPVTRHRVDTDLFGHIDALVAEREASARRRAMATTLVLSAAVVRDAAPRR
jgi:hypothetical protein